MIDPSKFINELLARNICFFSGVPDSLLAPFCRLLESESFTGIHVRAANEGNSIGMAIGHHLATREIPCVYMQNSGLGNCVNPLVSLAGRGVYSIPMILIIGWRGRPGVHDEPQHVKQGPITPSLLGLLDIPYLVIDPKKSLSSTIENATNSAQRNQSPSALLIPQGVLYDDYPEASDLTTPDDLTREKAIEEIVGLMDQSDIVVSTTGKTSRELFEIRKARNETVTDFLTVGGMGHASSVTLGISLSKPDQRVICFDGDGACAMHLGAIMTIGHYAPRNFVHIILNNKSHDSVGGQPTVVGDVDFTDLMQTLGYGLTLKADSISKIKDCWRAIIDSPTGGPYLLVIDVRRGARAELGRPSKTPIQNKIDVMNHIDTLR